MSLSQLLWIKVEMVEVETLDWTTQSGFSAESLERYNLF